MSGQKMMDKMYCPVVDRPSLQWSWG